MLLRRFWSDGRRRHIELFQSHVKPSTSPVLNCYGCGWKLQNENSKALGYQPGKALLDDPAMLDPLHPKHDKTKDGERCLCQRCWRIGHNRDIVVQAPDQATKLKVFAFLRFYCRLFVFTFFFKIKTLKDRAGVIVLIVDLTDVEGSLPVNFAKEVSGSNPVVLVGNKFDVLPDGATDLRLRNWLSRRAKALNLHPTSFHVTSSNTGHGIFDLVQDLATRSDSFKKDVFLCGKTNVGKSSLLNKLIRMYGGPAHLKTTGVFDEV
jgi:hypothetical protein